MGSIWAGRMRWWRRGRGSGAVDVLRIGQDQAEWVRIAFSLPFSHFAPGVRDHPSQPRSILCPESLGIFGVEKEQSFGRADLGERRCVPRKESKEFRVGNGLQRF